MASENFNRKKREEHQQLNKQKQDPNTEVQQSRISSDLKVEMVVARYNENLDWLKQVPSYIKIKVYNKGVDDLEELPSNIEVYKLQNLGKEGNTYFHYVISNYYNLSALDRVIFLQGNPFDHNIDLNYLINGSPAICNNIIANCASSTFSWQNDFLINLDWKSTKWNTMIPSNETFIEFANDKLENSFSRDSSLSIVYGGNFAIYPTNILCHDIDYHKKIYNHLQNIDPIEGYYMELLWNEWANCNNQELKYKVFLINLDGASERYESASEQFKKNNIEFERISATNGNQIKIKNLQTNQEFYGSDIRRGFASIKKYVPYKITCDPNSLNSTELNFLGSYNDFNQGLTAGELGVWCSNKKIWGREHKFKYNVIFEDDIVLKANFVNGFSNFFKFIHKDFDLGYMRQWKRSGEIIPIKNNPYIHKFNDDYSGWGADAVIFSYDGIQKLNSINNYFFAIDVFYWCANTGVIKDIEPYHSAKECDNYKGMLKAYGSSLELTDVLNKDSQIRDMGRGIKNVAPQAFSINDRGFWSGITAYTDKHSHDEPLAKALVKFFQSKGVSSIVDLGAGLGKYTKEFRENGISTDCYDGNPDTVSLSEGRCNILDLSQDINIPKHDWVMSLEVGEHLPKQYEDIFINNLVRTTTSGIVMSWALPGQGGDGHVNEQSNDYIKLKMASLGYSNNIEAENALRDASTLWWFKNTIMVFEPIQE